MPADPTQPISTNKKDQPQKKVIEESNELEPAPLEENWKLRRGAWEFGMEAGYAPLQPTFFSGRKEYDTSGRQFTLGSIRFGRVVGTKGPVTYQYIFEAIPVAFSIKNEVVNPGYNGSDEGEEPRVPATIRENTYSWGVTPAGFRFIFMPNRRVKPFAQVGAGFIFSKKPIPVPQSPTYNFAGDFGGGIMYSVDRRQTLNFGYRYYHISNMNIGSINPGYNASVFYFGYSWFSK
jgi:opacity protein-like surface antigen